jgi:MerR family redox-sensitive transcriptional activator SoxR
VAASTGVPASAIRYYERLGLLAIPARKSGRRRYTASVVGLIAIIQFAQRAGFALSEIHTLLHGFPADIPPAERWRTLASKKLQELDDLIAGAQCMRQMVQHGMRCDCQTFEECGADRERVCCCEPQRV